MKLSETRRLPDGSYDLTGRSMDEVLAEFHANSIIDWDAPITEADIARVEELVAKHGEDPHTPPAAPSAAPAESESAP